MLEAKGYKIKLNLMDNQATKVIKKFLDKNQCNLLLVEPHNHQVNATKHVIQTFKAHFISALATTDGNFPLQMWDQLTPQVEVTLNMLCPSCIDPSMLAYETVYGPYDWNCFPLAPPGCKAVVFEAPEMCGTWASRGIDAWYTGPSLDHYQCNHYFVPETMAYHISGSAELFPPPMLSTPISHAEQTLARSLRWTCHKVTRNPCWKTMGCPAQHQIKISTCQPYLQTNTHMPNTQMDVTPRGPAKGACYSPHGTKGGTKGGRATPPNAIRQITDAPPIMAAPNPTTKWALKLTKRTHLHMTRNKTPGSVLAITNNWTNQRLFLIPSPALLPAPTQGSLRHQTPITPSNIPHVCFQNIPGWIRHAPMISQELLTFLPNVSGPNPKISSRHPSYNQNQSHLG